MSRASLHFHLPEDEMEFEIAANGHKAFSILRDVTAKLRDEIKYESIPEHCKTAYEYAEYLKAHIWELVNEYEIANLVES